MSDGQLAVNTNANSTGLFFKDSSGALVKVGPVHIGTTAPNASPASGGATGNTVGEQWLDTSGGSFVLKIWDGSAWRSESGTFVDAAGDTMTGALVMDNQQQVRFRETTANGTNYIALQAPASVSSDKTITLPDVTGTVVTTGDTGTVTSAMLADGTVVDADISGTAAISLSKLATGALPTAITVASANIVDGTIVNGDINASAAIAGTKISPDFGSQNVTTTGTATAAALIPSGSSVPTNGVYLPSANNVAISSNSSERIRIGANGEIGLSGANYGTSGQVLTSAGSGAAPTWTTPSAGNTDKIEEGNSSAEVIDTGSDGRFVVTTEGSERLRVDSSGRLGLGTSIVGANLDVYTSSSRYIRHFPTSGLADFEVLSNNNSQPVFAVKGTGTADLFRAYANTTQAVTIDSSGRLGIGTTAATERLSINDSGANAAISIRTGGASFNSVVKFNADDTNYAGIGLENTALVMRCSNSSTPTERARIDSSGRLLVGTSSWASTARAVFSGNSVDNLETYVYFNRGTAATAANSAIGFLSFFNGAGSEQCASISCYTDAACAAGDSPGRLVFSTTADGASSPTERMRISQNGFIDMPGVYNFTTANAANVNVDATGGMRRSTSSKKYKTDIETLQDSYADALLNCRPVWYRSTCEADCPEHSYWGFIAEEVAAIDPRLVHWKTIDITYGENGSVIKTPCEPEPEGVAYDRFVPHLLNLIKRQGEAIAQLQAEVAALKAS